MLRIGETIRLAVAHPSTLTHSRPIKLGTTGTVIAQRRESDLSYSYLIKFTGHSGNRSLPESKIEKA